MKVVQLVYAHYINNDKTEDVTEKELTFSLSKSYDMYRYLLLLIVEVYEYGVRMFDVQRNRAKRLGLTELDDTAFVNNRFARQLAENAQLSSFREKVGHDWIGETIVRNLYNIVIQSKEYAYYRKLQAPKYEDDRTFWRKVYKEYFTLNEEIDAFLEERSIYWNDDKGIVDSFVLKTIRRFTESAGCNQPLLPDYDSDNEREFATKLMHEVLSNGEKYRQIIHDNVKNWDFSRLAYMDLIIMQVALAEICAFPTIPAAVSINEYIEIAKMYSTPKSYIYINGLLDATVKELRKNGALLK